jgi:tRNA pseudouridine55 synthase
MVKKMIHQARFELPELNINLEGDVLVFDKPYQCTSFDLVEKVKRYIRGQEQKGERAKGRKGEEVKGRKGEGANPLFLKAPLGAKKVKVGHAGTLDPLATGVMIICVGAFTKKIEQYQAQEKEYTGAFMLGATTPCFDLEKPIDETFPVDHITEEQIHQVARTFLGTQEQVPPHFSAVKIDGKRAYLLARQGEEPEIKPKTITISEFEITRVALPEVEFRIVCSKGTYIRSIARDFGQRLASGAHLTALRRTRIGAFTVEEAITVTNVTA